VTPPRAREILDLAEMADATVHKPEHEARAEALLAVCGEVGAAVECLVAIDPPAALRLAGSSSWFWQDAGLVDEGRRVVDLAISAASTEPTPALGRSLLTASTLAFRQSDQATAETRATQAIHVADQVGDPSTAAIAHANLARIAFRNGDAPEIERHARRALEVAGDDAMGRRNALHMLAWAAHTAGDLPEARRRFEASLDFRRTLGDRLSIAVELSNLGDFSATEGDLPSAAAQLAEALTIGHDLGSRYLAVNLLPSFAGLAASIGDDEAGVRLLGAADATARSSGLVADPGGYGAGADGSLRGRVEPDRFARLFKEGAALTPDESFELALRIARSIAGKAERSPA
jgi:tetratricopeptide (TPR) repeat protein